jgi:L-amino acid N-acyltransferase YncA
MVPSPHGPLTVRRRGALSPRERGLPKTTRGRRGGAPPLRLRDLKGRAREGAIPVLKEGFVGIYRWHAKRTLRTVTTVRAAELDGTIVGFALLERLSPEAGYVYYVAVSRASRRRGVGGHLLDDAIRKFRSDGVQVVYAAVERGNRASRALLRSRGFRSVARKELHHLEGGLGAWGLRSRMWIVSGEMLFGLRIAPYVPAAAAVSHPLARR